MSKLLGGPWPWVAAALVAILVFLSTIFDVHLGPPSDPRPLGTADDIAALPQRSDLNLLFILVDTLRRDHLGIYGYQRDTSPHLDQLAREGIRFERHLSQSSWTKCSMASLWTGMFPARSGILRFDDVIPSAARMPAEALKEAGFHTVGIYRNGWVAPTFGFEQGFDSYVRPAPHPPSASVRLANPTISDKGTDEDVVNSAIEFLRVRGKERWFLYLHLMDVHEYLYDEQSALFGSTYEDVYDNAVRRVDGLIDALLASLTADGFRDNTLVVIATDHGEAFRERGYEGHAREVYRETTDIPLVFSLPFRLQPGVEVKVRTRNVDVWPTLLDMVGAEPMPDTDGHSLLPEILAAARGEPPVDPDRMGIAHLDQHWGRPSEAPMPTVAVTEGTYRYVRIQQPDGKDFEQLFDSTTDPKEMKDVAKDDPAVLERLRKAADTYLQSKPALGVPPKREMGEMELNQLRALGYAIP